MAGYTRQSVADIINGLDITAPPLNSEFNRLEEAFSGATGHKHDGTTGNAPEIDLATSVSGFLPDAHGGVGGRNSTDETTNPTSTEDNTEGYSTGSLWLNGNTGRVFVCVGNATANAIWREVAVITEDGVFFPETNDTVDLGTTSNRFRNLFLSSGATISGNVSVGGTLGVTGVSTLGSTTASSLNSTPIGTATAAAATFTNTNTTGQATISSADINGGTIDGTTIGSAVASTAAFTSASASSGFTGDLTGNVAGNLSGNVTGNVTGNVSGNLTSSGTSSFENVTISGELNMDAGTVSRIVNLANPQNAQDAATKAYVDGEISGLIDGAPQTLDTLRELAEALNNDADAFTTLENQILERVKKSGDTMSGNLDMGANKVFSTTAPTGGNDLANKTYVDAQRDTRVAKSGDSMTGNLSMGGNKVTDLAAPTDPNDATRKAYVDDILGSATAAADSADAAAQSATDASNSALAASNSETNAGNSESAALTSEQNAATSAADALISEQNAAPVSAIVSEIVTVAGIQSEVIAVSLNEVNINTVAADIANVNTTAGSIANVNIVAGINSDVTTVSGISADVTATAANNADITIVATDIANVNATGGSIANVNTVAGSIGNVNTTAGSIANVNTVGTNISDVNIVAGISGDVTTVAGIDTDVTAVAGNAANINTVSGISSDVTTVSGISGNVSTVAGIDADVTTVAGISSDVSTVAANVTDVTNFSDVYLGPKSLPPTLRNDGSALQVGDLYFDTVAEEMRVFDGSVFVATGSAVNGTSARESFTATANQTTFALAGSHDPGFADVYLNGVKLVNAVDVDVTSGTEIVLTTGASAGDVVDVIAYGAFVLANTYTQAEADNRFLPQEDPAFTGTLSGDTVNPTTLQQGGSQAYVRSNILGSVSQSGGVPTGAIIQRGSNANGEFVRYADGTQICTAQSSSSFTTTNAKGALFFNNGQTFTFPVAFISTPIASPNLKAGAGAGPAGGFTFNNTSTSVQIGISGFLSTDTGSPGYIAIGRWF